MPPVARAALTSFTFGSVTATWAFVFWRWNRDLTQYMLCDLLVSARGVRGEGTFPAKFIEGVYRLAVQGEFGELCVMVGGCSLIEARLILVRREAD